MSFRFRPASWPCRAAIPAMRRGFGLLGLTRAIALETASDGMAEQGLSPKAAAQVPLQTKQPMHRCTTPKGIAALRLFLCGAEAATMTGAALAMDGAWTSVQGRPPVTQP
ncbi:MAG TPA: hypothetical protein VEY31_11975 [Roseococcus sp.]|jgi:NAD(P)-dependent dehydrogenase (short-subunit alcohol dehydrogenase family)|nr:hypothetical protein [Roseococcus sp.]